MRKSRYIIMVALLLLVFTACNKKDDEERPVMNIDYATDDSGEQYMVKNGSEQYLFQVAEGENYSVKVSVKTKKGKISIRIFKDGDRDDTIYEGNEIPDTEFVVYAREAGEYTIWTEVEDYVGTYIASPELIK